MYCEDCKKEVKTSVYNDKVKPVMYVCSECGQFIEGMKLKEDDVIRADFSDGTCMRYVVRAVIGEKRDLMFCSQLYAPDKLAPKGGTGNVEGPWEIDYFETIGYKKEETK